MKKIGVVLVSLVVAVLVIVGNALALVLPPPLGHEWKLAFTDHDGTPFYVNTEDISSLPEDIVKVWVLSVPAGEDRRKEVNNLEQDILLSPEIRLQGRPKNLWYKYVHYKINCKTNQFAVLAWSDFSYANYLIYYVSSIQPEKWHNIIPGTVYAAIEKYACE